MKHPLINKLTFLPVLGLQLGSFVVAYLLFGLNFNYFAIPAWLFSCSLVLCLLIAVISYMALLCNTVIQWAERNNPKRLFSLLRLVFLGVLLKFNLSFIVMLLK